MEKKVKRIALLSGGGDCPGLNAVIRTITKTAIRKYGWKLLDMFMDTVVYTIITILN